MILAQFVTKTIPRAFFRIPGQISDFLTQAAKDKPDENFSRFLKSAFSSIVRALLPLLAPAQKFAHWRWYFCAVRADCGGCFALPQGGVYLSRLAGSPEPWLSHLGTVSAFAGQRAWNNAFGGLHPQFETPIFSVYDPRSLPCLHP